jgi:cytidyltransferase-like protein
MPFIELAYQSKVSRNNTILKRVMVDMSCTILHHGHIRLLRKASKLGKVIVALTTDDEVYSNKGYLPELNFQERKEILKAISYVSEVIPSKWLIEDEFIKNHGIDILVHGNDNSNEITACEVAIFKRTQGISSSGLRKKSFDIQKNLNKN